MDEVAIRYAELWRIVTQDGNKPRDREECRMLVDRIRAAMDRGHARLGTSSPPGFVAGTFLIDELVYEGQRTQMHRLRHRDLGTAYALKTVHPSAADDAVFPEHMLREARMHLSLDHRNIVKAHAALRLADGRPALLLEWMGGGSLSQRLNGTRRFSAHDIQAITEGLLSGVQAIHEAGLVHADITPANILFSEESSQSLKIADFGIALEHQKADAEPSSLLQARSRISAPECAAGGRTDERSDLYSCGYVLSSLLERCEDDTLPATTSLKALARSLTHNDPDRRPQSAQEALIGLRKIGP